ncbi:MAG: precorrin-6Y C5,15-methyltransferase (decarboxylating) subunit CbiT [Selenomonadaceae bacterium]|nr:precorrin-6Y C5,15-methyltransferase (decarboxylating) subunit CbiT [Selenomonadaceae bacterium]
MNLGIKDEEFLRGEKIPMTKREVRILTLALARVGGAEIIADIGAGTGSLSIEAAKFSPDSNIFAVEKNPDAVEFLKKNVKKFSADNVTIIHAEASEVLKNFSQIEVALIGGSGGKIEQILDAVNKKLKVAGRIAANFIAIQNLSICLEWLRRHKNYHYEVMQVQVNHLQKVGSYDMARAANPIYILIAEKLPND